VTAGCFAAAKPKAAIISIHCQITGLLQQITQHEQTKPERQRTTTTFSTTKIILVLLLLLKTSFITQTQGLCFFLGFLHASNKLIKC